MTKEEFLKKKVELQEQYNQTTFQYGLVEFNRKALQIDSDNLYQQLLSIKKEFSDLENKEKENV